MVNRQTDLIDERRLDQVERVTFRKLEFSGAKWLDQLDTIKRRNSDRDSPDRRLIRDLNVDSAAAIHEIYGVHTRALSFRPQGRAPR
ncbi:hypothetical protein [Pandoraea commovens]|uniref:Uncharacterized protein n=1 Tax=Pandoraea commovens TaxID=2508289 RepID=A0ABY5QF30_9BURK|nr:hypothetical protein [Pandoraea commovens]UVA79397.1 hypothetical protein NTU39_26010 [Pandoraea commovens]